MRPLDRWSESRAASAHADRGAGWRAGLIALLGALIACGDGELPPGEILGQRVSQERLDARSGAQRRAVAELVHRAGGSAAERQILFGDLHVHTTYSIDAFLYSLPIFNGEGTHPPADACDFARYCSGVDFFSLNDHAEGLTPERWEASKQSIRECNARAGDPADPDLVAYVGWEWTQVGATPETHFGHKNVILRDLDDALLPARPITAMPDSDMDRAPPAGLLRALQGVRLFGGDRYADFFWWLERLAAIPNCAPDVPSPDLPADCRENAATPRELFRKLSEWNLPALVVPHGLAWGIHAPPGARLDAQLAPGMHDPERQRLIEIFSGHGNGEEYRPHLDRRVDDRSCPEPDGEQLACCWRAGEIMRDRCGGLSDGECEARVVDARREVLDAGVAPHLVFPDTRVEDWLDCDQCRDCFKPAYALRSGQTAQYSLALSGDPGAASRFRWGFIASSDDHHARPGTGYKQVLRRRMTDSRGMRSQRLDGWARRFTRDMEDPQRPQSVQANARTFGALIDTERNASFMVTGGLAAVHSVDRSRGAIWEALERREVYATSGQRILLWFDLLNGEGGRAPMGSELRQRDTPRFEVRAAGAFEQLPGCPEEAVRALGRDRLELLCGGECDRPGEARVPIEWIEVVRVRPALRPEEPVADRIEDPWRRFRCPADGSGCVVRFDDPEYASSGRDAVYYVRALQRPTPAINGDNFRTQFDADGNPARIEPCYGDDRTPPGDDCLGLVQERAWSSPIFLDQPDSAFAR